MKVVGARLLRVRLPLRVPFVISGGTMTVRESLIVELHGEDGHVGYGESAPFTLPFYSGETTSTAATVLRQILLPRIVGRDVADSSGLADVLSDGVRENHCARAGVETAWWDLRSRANEVPLARLVETRLVELGVDPLDCRPGPDVACGISLGIPPDRLRETFEYEVRRALSDGYGRIKVKVMPGWCAEPVDIAIAEIGASGRRVALWVDGNGSFDPARDRAEMNTLVRDEVLFVEQPFPADSLWDALEWERRTGAAVCLDESLTSDRVGRQVIAMGGPRIWNLKIQRLGGIEETCRVVARGLAGKARMWVGTMPETGLGAQPALVFASLPIMAFATDVEPSDRWYEPGTDVVTLTMAPDGRMTRVDWTEPDLGGAETIWSSM